MPDQAKTIVTNTTPLIAFFYSHAVREREKNRPLLHIDKRGEK